MNKCDFELFSHDSVSRIFGNLLFFLLMKTNKQSKYISTFIIARFNLEIVLGLRCNMLHYSLFDPFD